MRPYRPFERNRRNQKQENMNRPVSTCSPSSITPASVQPTTGQSKRSHWRWLAVVNRKIFGGNLLGVTDRPWQGGGGLLTTADS